MFSQASVLKVSDGGALGMAEEEVVIWSQRGLTASASAGCVQTVADGHIVCLMLFLFYKYKDSLSLNRTGGHPEKCEFKLCLQWEDTRRIFDYR